MTTRIISVDPLHPSRERMKLAAELIKQKEVVAFPTETVYGLGADATCDEAVQKIYTVKQRPADNPLICHFAKIDDIYPYVKNIPEKGIKLAEQFWPGPLTLILERTEKIATNVTLGLKTVAVRIPAHPVALSLIDLCGVPIAAPSANLSGKPSPTKADHVKTDFDGKIPLIIDGGSTSIGVESTVINLTTDVPELLRPGGTTIEELQSFLPDLHIQKAEKEIKPVSPGMKYTHYSPATKLLLLENGSKKDAKAIDQITKNIGEKPLILCTNSTHNHQVSSLLLGQTLKEIQVNLFASLRILDDKDHDIGIFEAVINTREGFTVMNRISKAAHERIQID